MDKVESENRTFKIIAITIISTFILSCFLTKTVDEIKHKSEVDFFLKRQTVRDSIITSDSLQILKLRTQRDSLIVVQNTIDNELDSAINIIRNHTKITVTDKDVIEALSWIKNTHGVFNPVIE